MMQGYMNRRLASSVALCLTLALVLPTLAAAQAPQLRTVARFAPARGLISDAALLGNGNVALAYPEAGYIADYSPDGKLVRNLWRTGGMNVPFRPAAISASDTDGLLAFCEVEQEIFRIGIQGNYGESIELSDRGIAPARLLSLAYTPTKRVHALLPDGRLLRSGYDGVVSATLDLRAALPYPGAVFSRACVLPDDSVYVLDYQQGAILYRRGPEGEFRRLRVSQGTFEAEPLVQDFAVDNSGNVLVATYDPRRPMVLLMPQAGGHASRPVSLNLGGPQPLAVRHSRGKFIVWARDLPMVSVLQLD